MTTTAFSDDHSATRDRAILQQIAQDGAHVDAATGMLWGTHTQPRGYHSNFDKGTRVRRTRESMNRAAFLLASPNAEHHAAGNALLRHVLALQDKNPASKTFGVWPWYAEEPLHAMAQVDYNWADFLGATLALVLHDYGERLDPAARTEAEQSLDYATRAIIRRNVGPDYTNIAIMGATVAVSAGELLGNAEFLDYGRARITRCLAHYRTTGGFNEYNSPTYTMVVVTELERLLHLAHDPESRAAARELLDEAHTTIARHWHQPTGEWAGPHSRSYHDRLPKRAKNEVLARAEILDNTGAVPESPLIPAIAFPESLREHFTNPFTTPAERHDVFEKRRPHFNVNGTTFLTSEFALGSASYHTFWEQARGLVAYWRLPDSATTHASSAVFRLRFLHDGNDFSAAWGRNVQRENRVLSTIGLLTNRGSMHPHFDKPKDAVFKAKSFRVVYQLDGNGATVTQLDAHRFALSAGATKAVVHVADGCTFDGKPVVWQTEQRDGYAAVVGICHEGDEKAFPFKTLGTTRIVAAVELLAESDTPSTAPVILSETDFATPEDGAYYAAAWQRLGDEPLLAPATATAY